jgi:hypothetical protein
VFSAVLDRADYLLLRLRGREDQLEPYALQMLPAVETICLTLTLISQTCPLGPLLRAIDPRQRQLMASSLLALDRQATAIVLDTRDDNTAGIKASLICALAVHSVFALAAVRPLLEQLCDDTAANRHYVAELSQCLDLLDTYAGS